MRALDQVVSPCGSTAGSNELQRFTSRPWSIPTAYERLENFL